MIFKLNNYKKYKDKKILNKSNKFKCGIVLSIVISTLNPIYNAQAATKTQEIYKLYAHTKLLNSKQFHCVDLLWTKESQWNPRSDNKHSSAFGIPQLLKMTQRDPFKQIDLGLRYIRSRYSTPCQAWAFFKKKGHY